MVGEERGYLIQHLVDTLLLLLRLRLVPLVCVQNIEKRLVCVRLVLEALLYVRYIADRMVELLMLRLVHASAISWCGTRRHHTTLGMHTVACLCRTTAWRTWSNTTRS